MPKTKPTIKSVAAAIRRYRGNLAEIARDSGVSRSEIAAFIESKEELQTAVADAKEAMLDLAEAALLKNVLAGNARAVAYYLAAKGAGRGYGKVDPDGEPIEQAMTEEERQDAVLREAELIRKMREQDEPTEAKEEDDKPKPKPKSQYKSRR